MVHCDQKIIHCMIFVQYWCHEHTPNVKMTIC